jgi:hypothetical protein
MSKRAREALQNLEVVDAVPGMDRAVRGTAYAAVFSAARKSPSRTVRTRMSSVTLAAQRRNYLARVAPEGFEITQRKEWVYIEWTGDDTAAATDDDTASDDTAA